ncbi:MAG TPA: carboxy-S-adenosyl-L-methionine synthase CmoA [Gammaproteobacteria bacterium]|nr:carboxy-S-adenosyl-L-methionine synthase CmoA [Gammaproteobacteria bacterium]
MRDKVFDKHLSPGTAFEFNQEVAEVFDDMVSRSVPFYDEIHRILLDIVDRACPRLEKVYDLGCSTGTTISILSKHLDGKGIRPSFIGIDNSENMLVKCREKIAASGVHDCTLHCRNIEDTEITDADLVVMNYTLQFLDPEERLQVLKNIHDGLRPGGVFVLSEKIRVDQPQVQELLTELYYDFKRRNGYSELEISQKREALENVLRPITPGEQLQSLREAGFTRADMIFRWYNFASYIGLR